MSLARARVKARALHRCISTIIGIPFPQGKLTCYNYSPVF